jgi:hypothetical protein
MVSSHNLFYGKKILEKKESNNILFINLHDKINYKNTFNLMMDIF